MTEHHFTIQHDDYAAEVALGGNWSLYEFAEFIIDTIGFNFDHPFEFCDDLENPYRSQERYTLFADEGDADHQGEKGVKQTTVSSVFEASKQMVFHFDYGDDWFFLITCTAVEDSTKKRKFKTVLSAQGVPPEQYPDYEE